MAINVFLGYISKSRDKQVQLSASTDEQVLQEVTDRLKSGISIFFFEKKDGTIRRAVGTLNPVLIEKFIGPATQDSSKKPDDGTVSPVQKYFDLEKMRFGSFVKANLISTI